MEPYISELVPPRLRITVDDLLDPLGEDDMIRAERDAEEVSEVTEDEKPEDIQDNIPPISVNE